MIDLRRFNEEYEYEDINSWEDIIGFLDVYQLVELLNFKYGREPFKDVFPEIEACEEDYNPDQFYEQLLFALDQSELTNDFVENFGKYKIEMEENDQFHWRYKQKEQKKFWDAFDDLD